MIYRCNVISPEFKFTRENASAERLCKAGIKQVKDRKYGEQFKGKLLRRLVLVFSQEAKQFVCWSEVNQLCISLAADVNSWTCT